MVYHVHHLLLVLVWLDRRARLQRHWPNLSLLNSSISTSFSAQFLFHRCFSASYCTKSAEFLRRLFIPIMKKKSLPIVFLPRVSSLCRPRRLADAFLLLQNDKEENIETYRETWTRLAILSFHSMLHARNPFDTSRRTKCWVFIILDIHDKS